jgi:predicted transcriptional regulator
MTDQKSNVSKHAYQKNAAQSAIVVMSAERALEWVSRSAREARGSLREAASPKSQ